MSKEEAPSWAKKPRRPSTAAPNAHNGAYWGYKWEAKKESNRIRRENWKREIRAALPDSDWTEVDKD